MVDLVRELSLLSALLLIRFILQHLDALPASRLVLAGLSHRVQLPHLVLSKMEGAGKRRAGEREREKKTMRKREREIGTKKRVISENKL